MAPTTRSASATSKPHTTTNSKVRKSVETKKTSTSRRQKTTALPMSTLRLNMPSETTKIVLQYTKPASRVVKSTRGIRLNLGGLAPVVRRMRLNYTRPGRSIVLRYTPAPPAMVREGAPSPSPEPQPQPQPMTAPTGATIVQGRIVLRWTRPRRDSAIAME